MYYIKNKERNNKAFFMWEERINTHIHDMFLFHSPFPLLYLFSSLFNIALCCYLFALDFQSHQLSD